MEYKAGDYIQFNTNARPRFLTGNVARIVAASTHNVTVRVPLEGFSGDVTRFWKPGQNFLVPLDYVILHAEKGG